MRSSSVFLVGAAVFGQSSAHYMFGRLILDNKWTNTWEYVRQISPGSGIIGDPISLLQPNIEPKSTDIVCGRNATLAWNKPKTASIVAGSRVGFGAGEAKLDGTMDRARVYHPGYLSAWLSKSPTDDLNAYKGDGDWFKILSVTGRTEQSIDFADPYFKPYGDALKRKWGAFYVDSWNFTIPATTPPGKYLLRIEHIFPNTQDSQFYPNCAHVDILPPSSTPAAVGIPGPLVKIPGVYVRGQPDVYFDKYNLDLDIDKWVPPKPEVWKG
ncbi:lytic polysaccharide monooxygenase [Amniculicola lignicola CBS 123094]|uniref:lytic cellulose monooxygenase (C4-dehydrogenating) n=1 Tax=Amniculicola lignicola CBS 123094 TaxID=1392246 RepID=A0A6A5X283_9PLEO|nr:lytic polysaccharide monooxygenase [Amniculicola lignicola CBS 123094]